MGRVTAFPGQLSERPPFSPQVPLDRLADLVQGLGHSQAGRMGWPTRIVIEDPADRGAIVQHNVVASRIWDEGAEVDMTDASMIGGGRLVPLDTKSIRSPFGGRRTEE